MREKNGREKTNWIMHFNLIKNTNMCIFQAKIINVNVQIVMFSDKTQVIGKKKICSFVIYLFVLGWIYMFHKYGEKLKFLLIRFNREGNEFFNSIATEFITTNYMRTNWRFCNPNPNIDTKLIMYVWYDKLRPKITETFYCFLSFFNPKQFPQTYDKIL